MPLAASATATPCFPWPGNAMSHLPYDKIVLLTNLAPLHDLRASEDTWACWGVFKQHLPIMGGCISSCRCMRSPQQQQ